MYYIDLSKFKVVYGEKVLNAISLVDIQYGEGTKWDDTRKKPKFIEVLVINEDGNVEAFHDETWRFQFIPILNK